MCPASGTEPTALRLRPSGSSSFNGRSLEKLRLEDTNDAKYPDAKFGSVHRFDASSGGTAVNERWYRSQFISTGHTQYHRYHRSTSRKDALHASSPRTRPRKRITHLVGCSGGCWRCREGETREPETHNPYSMSAHPSCHLLTRRSFGYSEWRAGNDNWASPCFSQRPTSLASCLGQDRRRATKAKAVSRGYHVPNHRQGGGITATSSRPGGRDRQAPFRDRGNGR
jgi:hypothetical protein